MFTLVFNKIKTASKDFINKNKVAALSLAISKNNKIIFSEGFGPANIEKNIKATPKTLFKIASITKTFTAIAILKLIEQGKIDYNDSITKFIPDYPVPKGNVTIQSLLQHTSGITNYTDLGEKYDKIENTNLNQKQVIELFKNEPFDFIPQTGFEYSNSGYYLLGCIIEKVTGLEYFNYIKKNILIPCNLNSTCFHIDEQNIKNRTQGYIIKKGKLIKDDSVNMHIPFSAGSLSSTPEDILEFIKNITTNKLIKKSTYESMIKPGYLNNGLPLSYGYGVFTGKFNDKGFWAHGGGLQGFTSQYFVIPNEQLALVVIVNTEIDTLIPFIFDILHIYSGTKAPEIKNESISSQLLAQYIGNYTIGKIKIKIIEKKGQLILLIGKTKKIPLFYKDKHTFFMEKNINNTITFNIKNNQAESFILYKNAMGIGGVKL